MSRNRVLQVVDSRVLPDDDDKAASSALIDLVGLGKHIMAALMKSRSFALALNTILQSLAFL